MVAANEMNNMKDANILLKADVSKFTSGDFEKSAEIIPKGFEVAQEHAAELEKYAVNDADWQAYVDAAELPAQNRPSGAAVCRCLRNARSAAAPRSRMNFTKYVNKPINTQQIEKTINDLQGTGLYSSISYNLIDQDGKTGLLVRPRLKTTGRRFSMSACRSRRMTSNDIQLGLGGRATFFGLAGPGSEVRVNASIGQVAGVSGELYKPLIPGKRFFVAPRALLCSTQFRRSFPAVSNWRSTRRRETDLASTLDITFSSKAELRVGEDYQWYGETLRIGTPIEQVFHITPFVSNVRFQYLGQDSVQVPTRGTEFRTLYTYSTQSRIVPEAFRNGIRRLSTLSRSNSRNHLWHRLRRHKLRSDEPGPGRIFAGRPIAVERVRPRRAAGQRLFSGAGGISLSAAEAESRDRRCCLCRRIL